MIYLFYGTDTSKSREKWRKVINAFASKYPSGQIFRFATDRFDRSSFEELIHSHDLFGEKRLVVIDQVLGDPEIANSLTDLWNSLVNSKTVFAFLEGALKSDLVKKIEGCGAKVERLDLSSAKFAKFSNQDKFNIFSLTDALGARDKKALWLNYQQALDANISTEEIFWKLVWQTKMMLLVKKTKSSESLKTVKPFVADKARRYGKNYQTEELEKLSGDLLALWHESKEENGCDFAIGLEKLILSL